MLVETQFGTHQFVAPEGQTVSQLLAALCPNGGIGDHVAVFIDDGQQEHEIYRHCWPSVRIKDTELLHVYAVPQGGGSNSSSQKDPLATIAGIALIAATTAVSGGILAPIFGANFAAGAFGANAAAAALGIGGSLVLEQIFPAPVAAINGPQQEGPAEFRAARSGNRVLQLNDKIPRVWGILRIAPPQLMPYTTLAGNDEIGHFQFVLAGPTRISEMQIDGRSIEDFGNDVQVEVREGFDDDPSPSLITQQRHTEPYNEELSNFKLEQDSGTNYNIATQDDPSLSLPKEHVFLTRRDPDEAIVRCVFFGIQDSANTGAEQHISLRLRIRKKGEQAWRNIGEVVYEGNNPAQITRDIRLVFKGAGFVFNDLSGDGTANSEPGNSYSAFIARVPAVASSAYYQTSTTDPQFESYWYGQGKIAFERKEEEAVIFIADDEFFNSDGSQYEIGVTRSIMVNDSDLGVVWVNDDFDATNYAWGGSSASIFDVYQSSGKWRVRDKSQTHSDQVRVASVISVWNEAPVQSTGFCVISMKARGLTINRFSVKAGGYVRNIRNGAFLPGDLTKRNATVSYNPALVKREILTGKLNKNPRPDGTTDDTKYADWHQECKDRDYEASLIIENESVEQAVHLAAACGRARIIQNNDFSVAFEKDRTDDLPIHTYSERNANNFVVSKTFSDMPSSIRATFANRDKDYEVDTITVDNPYGGDDEPHRIDYRGTTDAGCLRKRVEYDFAQMQLRAQQLSFSTDFQHLRTPRGLLINVHHPMLSVKVGQARILGVNVLQDSVELTLDDQQQVGSGADNFFDVTDVFDEADIFEIGRTYYALIQQATGNITCSIIGYDATTKVLTVPAGTSAEVGDMVHVGPGKSYQHKMLVSDVERNENLGATITAVPAAVDEIAAIL